MCEIRNWMKEGDGKSIYIFYGVADIEKSAVAKIVAEHAAKDGNLGVFYSRGIRTAERRQKHFSLRAHITPVIIILLSMSGLTELSNKW